MQKQKMSLANIEGKLSRAEMNNIMAGTDPVGQIGMQCICTDDHSAGMEVCDTCDGYCKDHNHGSKKSCD